MKLLHLGNNVLCNSSIMTYNKWLGTHLAKYTKLKWQSCKKKPGNSYTAKDLSVRCH